MARDWDWEVDELKGFGWIFKQSLAERHCITEIVDNVIVGEGWDFVPEKEHFDGKWDQERERWHLKMGPRIEVVH